MSAEPREPCVGSFTVALPLERQSTVGICGACGATVTLGYAGRIPLHAPATDEQPPRP